LGVISGIGEPPATGAEKLSVMSAVPLMPVAPRAGVADSSRIAGGVGDGDAAAGVVAAAPEDPADPGAVATFTVLATGRDELLCVSVTVTTSATATATIPAAAASHPRLPG
jgi:hypothetical protein